MSFLEEETGSAAPAARTGMPVDSRRARLVRAEQVRLLCRSRLPLAANVINAAIVCIVLWDTAPRLALLLWFGAMAAMVLVRLYLRRCYGMLQPAPETAGTWAYAFTVAAGVAGCLWGFSVWLLPGAHSFALDVFLAFVIGGMGAGAMAVNAAYLPAFYAFLLPSVIPLGAAFLLRGEAPYGAMALMIFLFVGLLSMIGHYFNKTLRSGFELQIDNGALIQELANARDRLASQIEMKTAALSEEIAERKATERALGDALEKVVVADRTKGEFLANMNHELRTPLNAIMAFAEIIKEERLGPAGNRKYLEYAGHVHESGQQLLERINDIMDLTRNETGEEVVRDEQVDVVKLARSALGGVKKRAQSAGIGLTLDCPDILPPLRADERKLKQVLAHLLSNAVKFTKSSGRVALRVACDPARGYLFEVADSGIGIAPEDMAKVLTPFAQADSKLERAHEGVGLGLPLAKSLVELHGGTLELESKLGSGTRATVRLPAARIGSGPAGDGNMPVAG